MCILTPSWSAGCSIWSVGSLPMQHTDTRRVWLHIKKSPQNSAVALIKKIWKRYFRVAFTYNHLPSCLPLITKQDDSRYLQHRENLQQIKKENNELSRDFPHQKTNYFLHLKQPMFVFPTGDISCSHANPVVFFNRGTKYKTTKGGTVLP